MIFTSPNLPGLSDFSHVCWKTLEGLGSRYEATFVYVSIISIRLCCCHENYDNRFSSWQYHCDKIGFLSCKWSCQEERTFHRFMSTGATEKSLQSVLFFSFSHFSQWIDFVDESLFESNKTKLIEAISTTMGPGSGPEPLSILVL